MEEKTNKEKNNKSFIYLSFLCVAILAFGFFRTENLTNSIASLIWFNLPSSAIIFLFFYLFVLKKHKKHQLLSFLAIYFCMILGNLIGFYYQKHSFTVETKKSTSQFTQNVDSMLKTNTKIPENAKSVDNPLLEIQNITAKYLNELAIKKSDYNNNMLEAGWSKILDPERIEKDGELKDSKIIVKKAFGFFNEYQESYFNLAAKTEESLQSIKAPTNVKTELIAKYKKANEDATKTINAFFKTEKNIIQNVENIINLLSSNPSSWSVQNNKIIFSDQKILNMYNAFYQLIQKSAQEQVLMSKQAINKAEGAIENIIESVDKL